MTAITKYLATAALVTGLVAVPLAVWVWPAVPGAIILSAGVAYIVQAISFLILSRSQGSRFLAAWAGGTLLRFATVLLVALFVARSEVLPVAPVLLSLVGFLFLLSLLEPVFYRVGMRSR